MRTHRGRSTVKGRHMSKLVRSLGAAFAVVLSVLTFVPGVAQAGVGNQSTPDIPVMLTVGDTNVPVSIQIGNTNDGGEAGNTNTVCNWMVRISRSRTRVTNSSAA